MGSDQTEVRQARDSDDKAIPVGIARDLSELARELQNEDDAAAVMRRIVAAAVIEIPPATGAGITLVHDGKISSPAHSDDRARAVGDAQREVREGPCLDTARDDVTLRSDDLRVETRWPKWAARAMAHGVRSVLSVQLFVERDSMGALDIFADVPHAFDGDAENTALLLAAHAAIALADVRKIENLQVALISRDVIGQAKGILMERYKLNPVQAFDLLIRVSQTTHRKLHTIAEELATTGEWRTPRA